MSSYLLRMTEFLSQFLKSMLPLCLASEVGTIWGNVKISEGDRDTPFKDTSWHPKGAGMYRTKQIDHKWSTCGRNRSSVKLCSTIFSCNVLCSPVPCLYVGDLCIYTILVPGGGAPPNDYNTKYTSPSEILTLSQIIPTSLAKQKIRYL